MTERIQLGGGGKVSRIEIGRPGVWTAKVGGQVSLSEQDCIDIAESVNSSKRTIKLKQGHRDIETYSPDCGVALAAEYDATKKRLIASIKPTEYLVAQNRNGAFTKISMELLKKGGRYVLDAIAFLGGHDPAIHGLEPVSLAAVGAERFLVCCAASEGSAGPIEFAGADEGSVTLHLAAQRVIEQEKEMGNPITYLEGVRRAEMALKGGFG